MNRKPSIYLRPTLANLISRIGAAHKNKTGTVVNAIAERYAEMIARNMPPFTDAEFRAIAKSINVYGKLDPSQAAASIAPAVHENMRNLEKHGFDLSLCKKIDRLSFAQKMSLWHMCEQIETMRPR